MREGRVLFVDAACPRPYSRRTLDEAALGGTEATVVRIATGLAARGRRVTVAQRGRRAPLLEADVEWIPYEHCAEGPIAPGVGQVVVVRCAKLLRRLGRRHPGAGLYLWMHCFPGARLRGFGRLAVDAGAVVVAVSEHHRRALRDFLETHDPFIADRVRVVTLHNPIAEGLRPDDTPVDRDALVFLSSPHKGLAEVGRIFALARQRIPSLRLRVCNPGYLDWKVPLPEGVVTLGKLPHAEAMRQTREAFCLFYPQTRFAETFGLVFAEANAVGTPVLTHPLGAAEEVLAQDPSQLVDASRPEQVIERLLLWRRAGRPRVTADPRFALQSVLTLWERLFSLPPVRRARAPTVAAGDWSHP